MGRGGEGKKGEIPWLRWKDFHGAAKGKLDKLHFIVRTIYKYSNGEETFVIKSSSFSVFTKILVSPFPPHI